MVVIGGISFSTIVAEITTYPMGTILALHTGACHRGPGGVTGRILGTTGRGRTRHEARWQRV